MKSHSTIVQEAKRLHRMGLAIHWLHPRSKRPVESGWTTGPRKDWSYLEETYQKGFNVGVRLGTPSKMKGGGYLAVIDVDVKSTSERHRKEALSAVKKLLGENKCPEVRSGRGNGSRHYYCLTEKPFKTFNPFESDEQVKVLMPSKSISKREREKLSAAELKGGWRLSRAWEISLYSDGRQVVLPPSIHPDTGKPYFWVEHLLNEASLPHLEFDVPEEQWAEEGSGGEKLSREMKAHVHDLEIDETLDVRWLPGISNEVRGAIVKGTGVTDRSAYLLKAAHALVSAGLDKKGILSVLTDPSTFLGECAYEHAQTQSRRRAADWLWKYTVKDVLQARDPVAAFKDKPITEVKVLEEEKAAAQAEEIEEETDWTKYIVRGGQNGDGPPKSTLNNMELILTKAIGPTLFTRDLFAMRDIHGMDAPWGAKRGDLVVDDDIPLIRSWFGKRWGFEPGKDLLYDVVTLIARNNGFDPVRNWLDRLPAWDKKCRLDSWLIEHFEAEGDEEYLAQMFRKWIVAMVMRIYVPGAKFDWMPIFEGAQGVGKSSFGRLLVGDTYFLDWLPNLSDKDSSLALQGAWAVEMGELASLRKNEIDTVKAYLTRTVDKVRPPFGRRTVESPRRCVFYGTTNRETYLRDETGNRRFKPVKVGKLNFDQLERDRDQLFAEARWLFFSYSETEYTMDLDGQAMIYERIIQKEKMVKDDSNLMTEMLLDFLEKIRSKSVDFPVEKFKLHDLFRGVGPLTEWRFDQKNMQLAARAIRKLKAEPRQIHGRTWWKLPLGGGFK